MGLDTVELIMAVEAEFGLDIPNAEASRLATVGDIYRYVAAWLGEAPAEPPAGALWERVCHVIERDTGVARRRLRPEAHIVRDLGLD